MSEHQPLVSVVMSSYNHERFVQKALLSIVNQTYKNIELIVIDDGSKDKTPDILKELQKEHGFYLECRTNHGLIKTLNYVISTLATGKYICGAASDDFWAEDRVEKMVAMMEANPLCGLGHSDTFYINDDDRVLNSDTAVAQKPSGDLFKAYATGELNIHAATMIIPRNVYQEVNYYDESQLIDDYPMFLKILSKYHACYLPEKLVYYRQHDTNMSKSEYKMLLAEERAVESLMSMERLQEIRTPIYLRFFSRLSKYDKSRALKYLFAVLWDISIYKSPLFYRGLRRLLFKW